MFFFFAWKIIKPTNNEFLIPTIQSLWDQLYCSKLDSSAPLDWNHHAPGHYCPVGFGRIKFPVEWNRPQQPWTISQPISQATVLSSPLPPCVSFICLRKKQHTHSRTDTGGTHTECKRDSHLYYFSNGPPRVSS